MQSSSSSLSFKQGLAGASPATDASRKSLTIGPISEEERGLKNP